MGGGGEGGEKQKTKKGACTTSTAADVEDVAISMDKDLSVKDEEDEPKMKIQPKAKRRGSATRSHIPQRRASRDSSWLKTKSAEVVAKPKSSTIAKKKKKASTGAKTVLAANRFASALTSKKKKAPSSSSPTTGHIPQRRSSRDSSWLKNASASAVSSSSTTTKKKTTKAKTKSTISSAYAVPKDLRATFSPQEVHVFESHFRGHVAASDKIARVATKELVKLLKSLGEDINQAKLSKLMSVAKLSKTQTFVNFQEFLRIANASKEREKGAHVMRKDEEGNVHVSSHHGAKHQYSKEEAAAFSTHINSCLSHDKLLLRTHLPLDPDSNDIFVAVRDGVLLSKLINEAVSDTIDVRAINVPKKGKSLSIFEVKENQNLVIESAKAIGCKTVGVHNSSLIEGPRCPHVVLGLVWQIVKIQLMSVINLKQHPELVALLKEGEELHQLLSLSPEAILLRWVNYHLRASGSSRRIKRSTFTADVKDSEIYTILLNQIKPAVCDKKALGESDEKKRAGHVLRNAKNMGIEPFIKPRDIVSGNRKLNFAFLAQVFNEFPGLTLTEKEAFEANKFLEESGEGTREERVYRMWMNSLNIEGLHVQSLFEDCRDGLALLKTMDKIQKGTVPWSSRKVNKKPKNKYHRVENTNMVVAIGKKLEFSLVGISGADLERGNCKLTLALVWQMLRMYSINLLTTLGGGKKRISEKGIRSWANKKAGGDSKITGFQDRTLRDGRFLMKVIAAMEPRAVNWDYVTDGSTKSKREENAKYVITCARKLGAVVFITYEDIVEVKPKMILLLLASLMAVNMGFDEVDGAAEDVYVDDDYE
eukprot:g4398.t1